MMPDAFLLNICYPHPSPMSFIQHTLPVVFSQITQFRQRAELSFPRSLHMKNIVAVIGFTMAAMFMPSCKNAFFKVLCPYIMDRLYIDIIEILVH